MKKNMDIYITEFEVIYMFFLLLKYFPIKIRDMLIDMDNTLIDKIEEIRIRAFKKISISILGYNMFLDGYIPDKKDISSIIYSLCDHSIYSRISDLKKGYITVDNGVRIGVCGKYIYDGNDISNVCEFTSINIRIPHDIKNICNNLVPYLSNKGKVIDTLIISPPGAGKTTLLRDMVRAVSSGDGFEIQNVCVIDERNEICGNCASGIYVMGNACDILSGIKKQDGIRTAIRCLAPEVIATDEIGHDDDMKAVIEAKFSGVTVIATAHASSVKEILQKQGFEAADKVFSRFVVLDGTVKKGYISQILNNKGYVLFGS